MKQLCHDISNSCIFCAISYGGSGLCYSVVNAWRHLDPLPRCGLSTAQSPCGSLPEGAEAASIMKGGWVGLRPAGGVEGGEFNRVYNE